MLRKEISRILERTARELHGEPWMRLHEVPALKKEIISSRMFGHRVYRLEAPREAMATYATGRRKSYASRDRCAPRCW